MIGEVKERKGGRGRGKQIAVTFEPPKPIPKPGDVPSALKLGRKKTQTAEGPSDEGEGNRPKWNRAELARRIKSLTDGTARLRAREGAEEGEKPDSNGGRGGGSATSQAGGGAVDPREREEDEASSWSRGVWFDERGRILVGADAPASPEILSSSASSSTIFCRDMLTSEDWRSCRNFTLHDIALLVRSQVLNQRCFAYDMIRAILEYSVHSRHGSVYSNCFRYLVERAKLFDALLRDASSSSNRGSQYSLSLLSDILLPSLLANYFAQKKGFGDAARGAEGSGGPLPSKHFRNKLATRLSEECDLDSIIRSRSLSESFSLSILKVMIALETQGIPSYRGPDSAAEVVSFLLSKLREAKNMSLKVHLVWFLLLATERDPAFVSKEASEAFVKLLGELYEEIKLLDGHLENALKSYLLKLFRGYYRDHTHADSRGWFAQTTTLFLEGGTRLAGEVPTGDLIAIDNLFCMLSENAAGWSKDGIWLDHVDVGINCLKSLLLHSAEGLDKTNDKTLYYVPALASGLSFFGHLAASAVKSQGILVEPYKSLESLVVSKLGEITVSTCSIYKSLLHQHLRHGMLVVGTDVGGAGTRFLHGSWHHVISLFLFLFLQFISSVCKEQEAAATDLAYEILSIHREKTYVVDEEEYLEDDSNSLLLWDMDAAHYSLLRLAIDTFLESDRVDQSVMDIVLLWDCAAEAIFRSQRTEVPICPDVLFSAKLFSAVLQKREEILAKKWLALGPFEADLTSCGVANEAEVAQHIVNGLRKGDSGSSQPIPDWMYDISVCEGRMDLYPLILLYLLCIEVSGSKYLLGLPVSMKLSKILHDAYCKSDALFKEDAFVAGMPLILKAHLCQVGDHCRGGGGSAIALQISPAIVDQFLSVSLGEQFFGLCASLALCNAQPVKDQVQAWKAICSAGCFHLFPCVSCYDKDARLLFFTLPYRAEMVDACFESMLTSESMKSAVRDGCITGYFALHCVSEFCFGPSKSPRAESKRAGIIHRALAFLDDDMLRMLFRYSVRDGVPSLEDHPSDQKVATCKSIVGSNDIWPSFFSGP
ncbi:hypothetical protein HOP50_01g00040 [Chloropicon primus]|nr:hypothetical protein HOP50_01g00040 [Chloropicon primus]